ncbi:MAG: GTP-binding protein [Patescibacteria group bacterium]|nr:GTP-binding protein [Patescibacteria group bacterium]
MSKKDNTGKVKERTRPPIVVVMGHVDHGKTKLLDYIRKTNIAGREAGGITQSIGAYEITHEVTHSTDAQGAPPARKITFIDTPGHEAFSKMRERGAQVADLAILVVAADEGVKPQTKDALKYILKEKITFIVAINKIDKPNANIEKIKQELGKAGVLLEGFGGNISWHAISAKTGEGVSDLLDLILLAADLEKATYNPDAPASGIILTSHSDPRRGPAAGVIVTNGRLQKGQFVSTESTKGKVKILEDFKGDPAEFLEPSAPAMILGFESLPEVGEKFSTGVDQSKKSSVPATQPQTIESKELLKEIIPEEKESLKVLLKANETGSLDALLHIIQKITQQTKITVINKGVGNLHESDVKLAAAVGAVIIGFRVKADKTALSMAKMQKINIMTSPVIYELEKNLEEYILKNISQEIRTIEILAIFGEPKGKKQVVGGRVVQGSVKNLETFEIINSADGDKVIGEGKINNLQSQKKDVSQAETDQEVGLLVESETQIKVGNKLVFNN